jgi:hypothetical protein
MTGCDTPQLAVIEHQIYVYFVGRTSTSQVLPLPLARARLVRNGQGTWALDSLGPLAIVGGAFLGQTDPSLLRLPDGRYRLYYVTPRPGRASWAQADPAYNRTEISSAISTDATTWLREPGPRLEGRGLVDPEAVVAPDGRIRLMYTSGTDLRAHSAISADGLDFTVEEGARVDGGVTDTRRMRSGGYLMVFQGVPFGTDFPPLMQVRSEDAFRFPNPQVLNIPGAPRAGYRLEAPSQVELEDGSRLLIFLQAPVTRRLDRPSEQRPPGDLR